MLTRKNILFIILAFCVMLFVFNFHTYWKQYRNWFYYMTNSSRPRGVTIKTTFSHESNPEVEQKIQIAQAKQTPSAQLAELAEGNDPLILQLVARHPNTSQETLENLVYKRNSYITQAILTRADLKSDMLSSLAHLDDEYIQQLVARHPNTSQETLAELTDNPSFRVTWEVARNPLSSSDVIDKAIRSHCARNKNVSKFIEVRRAVASHSNTSPQILTELASDPEWEVRYRVAGNPNTPGEAKVKLTEDENEFVRQAALAE